MNRQEAVEIAVTVGDAAILIAGLRDYAVRTIGNERAVCGMSVVLLEPLLTTSTLEAQFGIVTTQILLFLMAAVTFIEAEKFN